MTAGYLLRFDDLRPTMNWGVWSEVEAILIEVGVKPIVAVIPDNQDDTLRMHPPHNDFWGKVREWQEMGWTVALHGYQHRYITADDGIVRIRKRSEFAGLPHPEQKDKLEQGLRIFRRERIKTDVWVAPGHSFDETTVLLLRELGVRYISDGFSCFPYRDRHGMVWVPQQLWRFRWMPFGIWTICFHVDSFGQNDILRIREDIRLYRGAITAFAEVVRRYGERDEGVSDRLSSTVLRSTMKIKRIANYGRPA